MACNKNIKGIMILTCDEDGNRVENWLNLNRVQAISWCDGEVKGRGANPNPTPSPESPWGPEPKNPCGGAGDEVAPAEESVLCWWDGNDWVCH